MANMVSEDPPACFGGKLWDPKSAECAGGTDPAFTDETGRHIREKCMFFEPCGSKSQAVKLEAARSLLDPRQLVRRNEPPTIGPSPQQRFQSQALGFVDRFAQAVAQQPQRPPQVQQVQVQGQQHQQQYMYQQMMPVNYQMPAYLTVPETRFQGQSFWNFLALTVLRSIGKSLGHSIAHIFDTTPLQHPPVDVGVGNGARS